MASIKVNPPPQIVLPQAFKNDIAVVNYFSELDRTLLQLWTRTGGANDFINSIDSRSHGFDSITQQLRKELDGLPEFTIDTTGFTIDLTFITTDKAIA